MLAGDPAEVDDGAGVAARSDVAKQPKPPIPMPAPEQHNPPKPTDDLEFPIFPLDSDPNLTAEITWESGRPPKHSPKVAQTPMINSFTICVNCATRHVGVSVQPCGCKSVCTKRVGRKLEKYRKIRCPQCCCFANRFCRSSSR